MQISRKSIGFLVAGIIAIGLVLIHVPEVGQRQENYTLNSGEITGANAIGQTIVAQKNNLNGIGVLIATYSGRDNTHPVILHLRESVETTHDIRTVSVSPTKFGDNQFYNFLFQPIAGSNGKTYFFIVDSPESVHGNAIAIDLNAKDVYQQGTAYVVHTADSKPITDSQLQRSGKQNIDTAFQTLYSVPLGTYLYDSARNAMHLFISTWQTNKQSYAVWTLSFLPSVACIMLCIYLFRSKQKIKSWKILVALAIIAAILRTFYALALPFTDDEGNYLYDAWSLLHGHFAGGDGYVKAPLVILWIAIWEAILGHTALAGRISSIIAGSALVFPIFMLVRSIWTTRAALISSALWATMGTAVVSTIYVHTQPVAIFFGMAGMALLAYALQEKKASQKSLIIAGAVIELAVASRKSMLALGLAVILLLVSLSKNWNSRLKNTLYVGIGFLSVLALFMLYAYIVYGGVGIT
ncbi:MAG: glycosyltransferase family 39 protein, partial [Candidatus Andersenbacteria bacterium]